MGTNDACTWDWPIGNRWQTTTYIGGTPTKQNQHNTSHRTRKWTPSMTPNPITNHNRWFISQMVRLCNTIRRSASSSTMLKSRNRRRGLSSTQGMSSTANATFENYGKRRTLKSQNPFLTDLSKKSPNGSCSSHATMTSTAVGSRKTSEFESLDESNRKSPFDLDLLEASLLDLESTPRSISMPAYEIVSPVFESQNETNRKTPFDLDFLEASLLDLGSPPTGRRRRVSKSSVAGSPGSLKNRVKGSMRKTPLDRDLLKASLPHLGDDPVAGKRIRLPKSQSEQLFMTRIPRAWSGCRFSADDFNTASSA